MSKHWWGRRVLVTGASGFLGSNLCRRLAVEGAQVVALVRHQPLETQALEEDIPNCVCIEGDVRDYKSMREIISTCQIDTIFHLAAYSIVSISAQDPWNAYDVNIMGTVSLLEAARNVGKCSSIVVASSDKAYGDHITLPYTEDFSLVPKNTYDVSKACMDMISRSYASNYGMPVAVTRCSNIYGPGDMNLSRLIPNTILRIMRGLSPLIYTDVAQMIREFIYVHDVTSAYEIIGSNVDKFVGVPINIGGNGPSTIIDVISKIQQIMGDKNSTVISPRDSSFKEIQEQWIDSSKLYNLTGWQPSIDLEKGLTLTVDWYKKKFS